MKWSGGAHCLVEMERFDHRVGENITELAEAVECVSLPVVWAWTTHFNVSRTILRVLCGYLEHQRRLQFEGCVADLLRTITAILFGSKWSCLLLCLVLQDTLSEVVKVYPPFKV